MLTDIDRAFYFAKKFLEFLCTRTDADETQNYAEKYQNRFESTNIRK